MSDERIVLGYGFPTTQANITVERVYGGTRSTSEQSGDGKGTRGESRGRWEDKKRKPKPRAEEVRSTEGKDILNKKGPIKVRGDDRSPSTK